ncbi:MAG: hypothetical protein HY741_01785 [Chloroflexi bacterium]|nr:hypothetical protein [Chloroflexota bacterium]
MEKQHIGEYLVVDKRLAPEELEHALYIQCRRAQVGAKPLLGTLLVEMGWVSQEDVAFALEQQAHEYSLVEFTTRF